MKAVMISIQPKWCELIACGLKTIEVRKTRPKIDTPFKCYIYCTKESKKRYLDHRFNTAIKGISHHSEMGKVIGEFVCDNILHSNENAFIGYKPLTQYVLNSSCLTLEEVNQYRNGKNIYAWHISDLVIYDKPREIGEFKKAGFMTEEEWLFNLYPNTHCHYEAWAQRFNIEKPPKSWCLVEEKENENE